MYAAIRKDSPDLSVAERREAARYPLIQPLSYRILDARSHYPSGTGLTVDMSSSGVLFAAGRPLPLGKRVELSIHWPAQLDGGCALKLVAIGRIVRVQGGHVAMRLITHEFRTRAMSAAAAAD